MPGTLAGPAGAVLGAAAGAAVGSAGGQTAELGINQGTAKQFQTNKGDFSEFSKKEFLGTVAIDTAVTAASAGLWAGTGAREAVREGGLLVARRAVVKSGATGLAEKAVERGVRGAVKVGCQKALTAPVAVAKVGATKILGKLSKKKKPKPKPKLMDIIEKEEEDSVIPLFLPLLDLEPNETVVMNNQ